MKKIVKLKGMHCPSCEVLLSEALSDAGIKVVSANHKKNELVVDIPSESVMDSIRAVIKKEGYSVV